MHDSRALSLASDAVTERAMIDRETMTYKPTSWKTRKYNDLLTSQRVKMRPATLRGMPLDATQMSEENIQILETMTAQSAENREKRRKKMFDVFLHMENRLEESEGRPSPPSLPLPQLTRQI